MNLATGMHGKRKEGEPITVELAPAREEQREDPYPDTVIEVLQRLRVIAVDQKASKSVLQEEGELARAKLLEISAEALAAYRKAAESSEKEWVGRLILNASSMHQDGLLNVQREGVEVERRGGIILFGETVRSANTVTEETSTRISVSNGCTSIFWVEDLRSTDFDGEEIPIERTRIEFLGNKLRSLLFMQVDGQDNFYHKPVGPVREHKIQLIP